MKRPVLACVAALLAAKAGAGSLYPMEGGNLGHNNAALSASTLQFPLHTAWTSASCLAIAPPRQHPIVLSDRLILASQRNVTAIDRASGAVLWSWSSVMSDFYSAPCYDASRDLIYQADIQGAVAALRPSDGQVQWIFSDPTLPAKFTLGGCTYVNDKIYVTNGMSQMLCIDAATHTALWRTTYPGVIAGGTTPAYDSGRLFVATNADPAHLFCIDATTGSILWNKPLPIHAFAAVTVAGSRIYVMRNDGAVECRLASDGSVVWTYQTASWSTSNLAVCGSLVIASSDDRHVYGLDQATGSCAWSVGYTGNFARCAPIVVCGKVFVSGCAGQFYAIDGKTGSTIWTFNHPDYNDFVDWAEADGSLYVADQKGHMYCFTSDTPGDPSLCVCNLTADTMTPTPQVSPTMTPTFLGSFTATPTATPTQSTTFTRTLTQTRTYSSTYSATPTFTLTRTSSLTVTLTLTLTPTPSKTPTLTPSPDYSPTPTVTVSRTPRYDDVPEGHDPGDIDDNGGGCYPNPVRNGHCRIAFRMPEPGRSTIRVFAADGSPSGSYENEHSEAGLKSVPCDFSDYAPGVYFFIVNRDCQSGRKTKTRLEKFIVIK